MNFSVGRFSRPIYQLVKGKLSLPLINGVLFLTFISFSNYLIIDVLSIEKRINQFLVCLIMTVNYSNSLLTATHIHDLDVNGFSILCICLGIWLIIKYENNILVYVVSAALFVFSLGLYQAYIELAISIFIIIAILKLNKGKDLKCILLRLIQKLFVVALSMIVYYALFKVITLVFNVPLSNYHNPTEALDLSFADLNNSLRAQVKSLQV